MNHSAHRRHRPRRAPPQRRPYGLNKNGSRFRESYSLRIRRSVNGHMALAEQGLVDRELGDRSLGRLSATEIPDQSQRTSSSSSEPRLPAEQFDGTTKGSASFQSVQLQSPPVQSRQQLEDLILQRIHTRLPGRVRDLIVCITDDLVELTGECRTYYTKQMAQHVAMGVLDYQQLVNNINVVC